MRRGRDFLIVGFAAALCFDGTRQRLLSGALDRHVKVYDIVDYKLQHSMRYPAPVLSMNVAVSHPQHLQLKFHPTPTARRRNFGGWYDIRPTFHPQASKYHRSPTRKTPNSAPRHPPLLCPRPDAPPRRGMQRFPINYT